MNSRPMPRLSSLPMTILMLAWHSTKINTCGQCRAQETSAAQLLWQPVQAPDGPEHTVHVQHCTAQDVRATCTCRF